MKSLDMVVSKSPKHSDATDPENHFLTKTIMLISSIKEMGECSVPFSIFRKVGIQKIDRNLVTTHPLNLESPSTEMDNPAFDLHRGSWKHHFQEILNNPS